MDMDIIHLQVSEEKTFLKKKRISQKVPYN